MALNKLMTVFEIHNHNIMNLCVQRGSFYMSYGYVTLARMREAYPDRPWYRTFNTPNPLIAVNLGRGLPVPSGFNFDDAVGIEC